MTMHYPHLRQTYIARTYGGQPERRIFRCRDWIRRDGEKSAQFLMYPAMMNDERTFLIRIYAVSNGIRHSTARQEGASERLRVLVL